MATTCRYEFQAKNFGFGDASPEDFYVSQWSSRKSLFIVYRILIFVYWTTWSIIGAVEYSGFDQGNFYYIYLSHWDEWILVLNLGVALAVAVYGCHQQERGISGDTESTPCVEPEGKLRWFHCASWILKSVSPPLAYVVTLMFWILLGATRASMVVNIHRHAINSVFVTLDLLINRVPVRLLHFIYPVILGIIYIAFTLLLHFTGIRSEIYTNTLDWATVPAKSAITVVLAVFVALPSLYVVTFGIYHLRAFIARKYSCQNTKNSGLSGQSNQALELESSDDVSRIP